MKKYLLILVLLSANVFTSCDDFLERNPHDRVTDNTFWKNIADAEKGLTACYNCLFSSPLFNHTNPEWDCMTDNAFDQGGGYTNIYTGIMNSQSGNIISLMYYDSYKAIARFNDFIVNVENMDILDEKKKRMLGEVKFLRGMYYFYLTQLYGSIPLITEPYEIGDELKIKSPKEDIFIQIHKDLDYAIANLPEEKYDGHAVQGSAKLLKIKVFMVEQKWNNASELAKSLFNSVFSLSDNFKTMFEAKGQDNNPEIIFSTRYLAPHFRQDNPLRYGWWIRVNPYESFTEVFECTDGKSIDDSPLYDPEHPYENRDPRLFYSIVTPGSEWRFNDTEFPIWDPVNNKALAGLGVTGFTLRKVWEWERTLKSDPNAGSSEADAVLMRFGEVLLDFAESENEVNGPTNEVYNAVNKLRARKSVEMPPLPLGLTQETMREKIRLERRVEMAFEMGTRFFDLKRWGVEKEVLDGFDTTISGNKYTFKSHYVLWPIPQSEIDYYKSQGKDFGQNPGYD